MAANYRPYAERRQQVLTALRSFQESNGYPPSGKELAASCGVSRSQVDEILARLRDEGLVKTGGGRRTRVVTAAGMKALEEMV
jgi:DNA-binding FadR family transcriptional regulator